MSPKIIIATHVLPEGLLADLQKKYEGTYEVISRPDKDHTPSEEDFKEAVALFGFVPPANLLDIKQTPNLKLIQGTSAGYFHWLDTPVYKSMKEDNELIMASASGIHVVVIAEHVIATTLALYHALPRFIVSARAHSHWISQGTTLNAEKFGIRELRGRTMGVLGYGHIGREIGRMAKLMGMKVVAATRSGTKAPIGGFLIDGTGDHEGDIPSAWYATGSKESMHDFYSSCDVVVNTLPASQSTNKTVDESSFRSMKDTAIFVNIGRGDTVDQDALITALQAGSPSAIHRRAPEDEATTGNFQIGAASLDVTTPEPLPSDSPLYTLENVLLTPHMSGMSEDYYVRAFDLFSQNIDRVLKEGKGALNAFRGRGE